MSNVDLSKYSVEELKKLGGKVDKEIEKKKRKDILELREEIEKMTKNRVGMSAEDVIFFGKRKPKKTIGEPKYFNPSNPKQTWTGRGKRPGWYQEAIKSGKTPDDLAINK